MRRGYTNDFLDSSAKRYERMMRAHGIAPNAATVKPAPNRVTKVERRESRTPKKRKGDAFIEDNGAADDEETFANNIKTDPVNAKEELEVKEEHSAEEIARAALDTNAGFMQYMDDYSLFGNFETEPEYSVSSPGYSAPQTGYDTHQTGYTTPQAGYGYDMQANDSYSYTPATMTVGASSGGDANGMSYQQYTQPPTENHGSQNSIILD